MFMIKMVCYSLVIMPKLMMLNDSLGLKLLISSLKTLAIRSIY